MSYQAFKLDFKEFKLIAYGWGVNLLYLLVNVFSNSFGLDEKSHLITRTILDITCMSFFLIATIDILKNNSIRPLRGIKPKHIIIIGALASLIKLLPAQFNVISYIHFRFLPAALFDIVALVSLGFFFRQLAVKFQQSKVLSFITFFYAGIQIIFIAQKDTLEPNLVILSIDNVGFALGLLLKILILISFSKLLVYAVKIKSTSDKEALLKNFSKATTRILDIEKNNPNADYSKREEIIINLTLIKLLSLLKKKLGYFSLYIEKENLLEIKHSSEHYKKRIGIKYPANKGLTGKSINTREIQIMHSPAENNGYQKFDEGDNSGENVKSAIAIPLIIEDSKPLGVFLIECEQEYCFKDLEISIIKSLIHQATVAIKNNRLIHDIEISKFFLDCLKDIDKQLVFEHQNLEPVLSFILERALQLVNCDTGNIDIVDGNKLICIASTNKTNIGAENDINDCLSGLAVIDSKKHYFPDLSLLSYEHKKLYKNRLGEGYKCELIIPLVVKQKVIGVFNAESKVIDKFSKEDTDKIDGFAGQTAIAIYITKLIEDINEKNRALENSVDLRNIEMSFLLGHLINHRIGNEVGIIRLSLLELIDGEFGEFDQPVMNEFKLMLSCADKALSSRTEIRKKVKELITFNPTKIDFLDIKSSLENNQEYKLKEKIHITIIGFHTLKSIFVNLHLLMEVFFELISNAIKSMPDGGEIIITGKHEKEFNSEKGTNIISFRDHGCGISSENLPKIFEDKFTYWPDDTAGGGIGLCDVKNIIDFWDGDISVESKLNAWTIFTIKLPTENLKPNIENHEGKRKNTRY
jgi:transcriptional regulator with GAF, ATPase, and Fis domain